MKIPSQTYNAYIEKTATTIKSNSHRVCPLVHLITAGRSKSKWGQPYQMKQDLVDPDKW